LQINRIHVNKRTGIPMESGKLTKKALARLDDSTRPQGPASICSVLSMLSVRDPNETPEEKKERKRQLKEYRKVRIAILLYVHSDHRWKEASNCVLAR
jgi:protein LTV1